MLYLVPTPIGNLEDITYRAVRVLQEVDLILAEDTRVTRKLLDRYDIETALSSFHSHNEHRRMEGILSRLKSGETMALVSDAGSPGISDPGFLIVREALAEGIQMEMLPGATALIPAVVLSGLPCEKFHFEGFLPQKKGKQTRLKYLLALPHTFVMYESPYRVVKTLKMIQELSDSDRQVSISRELTKLHEEHLRGKLSEVLEVLSSREKVKGEIVMVVEGADK